ncbi:M20 family metallopeptidase [Paenibacillus sp. TH7-28]
MDVRHKIITYIDKHREEAIQFLREMVRFDSTIIDQGVDGKEKEIQEWLAERLESWGYKVRLFEPDNDRLSEYADYNPGHIYHNRPNLVAVKQGTGEGRSILLNGHVDTVAVGDLNKWSHSPWSADVSEGRIYGRGTTDMKGGVAAMILAARFLEQAGVELKGDLMIQSVVDEEGGGNGTLACVAEGYRADAAVVTEPTRFHIQPIGRGVLLLEVEVYGKANHACYKWEGVNAIEKAMKIAEGLKELEHEWIARRSNPQLPGPSISLGYMNGGIAAPIVPDACTLKFDIKYLPVVVGPDGKETEMSGDQIKFEVEERIRRICSSDSWLEQYPPRLNWFLHVMPHRLEPSHELVATAAGVSEELFGWSKISGLPSGSDARHLLNSGGIPSIVFGPGDMRMAHTIDESIGVEEYISAIKALALIILDWTNKSSVEVSSIGRQS